MSITSGLAEFTEKLEKIIKPEILDVNGRKYSTHEIEEVKDPTPDVLRSRTLASVVEYIKKDFDAILLPDDGKLLIHIVSQTLVDVYSPIFGVFQQRKRYLFSEAELPEQKFGQYMGQEQFKIWLQSAFKENDKKDQLLALSSLVIEEVVKESVDNGISQVVKIRDGVSVKEAEIENPVKLIPIRTFMEAEQPESEFVFRIGRNTTFAIFEGDGGIWKIKARQNVKQYLEDRLQEEIEQGKVCILA